MVLAACHANNCAWGERANPFGAFRGHVLGQSNAIPASALPSRRQVRETDLDMGQLRIGLTGDEAHLGEVAASDVAYLILGIERALSQAASVIVGLSPSGTLVRTAASGPERQPRHPGFASRESKPGPHRETRGRPARRHARVREAAARTPEPASSLQSAQTVLRSAPDEVASRERSRARRFLPMQVRYPKGGRSLMLVAQCSHFVAISERTGRQPGPVVTSFYDAEWLTQRDIDVACDGDVACQQLR